MVYKVFSFLDIISHPFYLSVDKVEKKKHLTISNVPKVNITKPIKRNNH